MDSSWSSSSSLFTDEETRCILKHVAQRFVRFPTAGTDLLVLGEMIPGINKNRNLTTFQRFLDARAHIKIVIRERYGRHVEKGGALMAKDLNIGEYLANAIIEAAYKE